MSAAYGRIRSGSVSDLQSSDRSSVLITGRGRAALTATFDRTPAHSLTIEYRAASSGSCRHRLAAWSRAKTRWVVLSQGGGRTFTATSRLPAAVDRSKPIRIRGTCTHRGAPVQLRIDLLRGVRG
jgi:hypothetical protein